MAGSGHFSLISQVFPGYFYIISLKISHFPTISQLFPIYFTCISHFPTISHLFLKNFLVISNFPTITSHFSVTLPNYFLVKVRIFSAVCSCSWSSRRTDYWLWWTKSSFCFNASVMESSLKSKLNRCLIRNRQRVVPRVINLLHKKRPPFRHPAFLTITATTAKAAKLLQVHSIVLLC